MPIDVKGKEDFVSGHSGTSWLEVLLITCVFPCAVVFFSIGAIQNQFELNNLQR